MFFSEKPDTMAVCDRMEDLVSLSVMVTRFVSIHVLALYHQMDDIGTTKLLMKFKKLNLIQPKTALIFVLFKIDFLL